MEETTTDSTTEVVNTIIGLIETNAGTAVSDAVQKKIAVWTEEIATTKSSWVQMRDTIYILASSWAAMKATTAITAELAKLKK